MHTSRKLIGPFALTSVTAALLVACGGGGGGSESAPPPAVNFGATAPLPTDIVGQALTMNCIDGADWQCSGSMLRTDNGVGITNSGVQAYGRSTSDLQVPNPSKTTATGLEPVSTAGGGVIDMRFRRNATTLAVTEAGMVMTNLGITWDDLVPRPPAIELFEPSQGVTKLNANGSFSRSNALPVPTTMSYYDWAALGATATQPNYANNRYFPRPGSPVSCPTAPVAGGTTETCGIIYTAGAFRTGGTDPDRTTGLRFHSDGDVKAGSPPGTAVGVPFAGNKGFRNLVAFSYNYANLGTWLTEETAEVDEWAGIDKEHTVNRRGVVAFGQTTTPSAVPEQGVVNYAGVVYGWYTPGGSGLVYYRATATLSVDFATRQVAIRITGAAEDGNPSNTVPLAAEVTTGLGDKKANVANYFTGAATSTGTTALKGGIGGRLFGPITAGRSGNVGPAEIAGSFSLLQDTPNASKAATVGGFVGRIQ